MLFLLLILLLFSFTTGQFFCDPGERLHTPRTGPDVCLPCEDGEFMPEEYHSHRVCRNCTSTENHDLEITVTGCTRTHDTVILCQPGYYRYRARNFREKDTCKSCTKCEFPARDCQGYDDTVCCPPNHDAVMISGGLFSCQERPFFCGPGQYFSEEREECLPCFEGTYMYAHNHRYRDCLKCETLSHKHSPYTVITQPCTRHSPTIFGCESGYCKDSSEEVSLLEAVCSPCRRTSNGYMMSHTTEGQTVERQKEEKSKKEMVENDNHYEASVNREPQHLAQTNQKNQALNVSNNRYQTRTEIVTTVSVPPNESHIDVHGSGEIVLILFLTEISLFEILILGILFRFKTFKLPDSVDPRFRKLCRVAFYVLLSLMLAQFASALVDIEITDIVSRYFAASMFCLFFITSIIVLIFAEIWLIRGKDINNKPDKLLNKTNV